MSRVGKNPVVVPDGVTVDIAGQRVTAKGKLGEMIYTATDDVEITREDNLIFVKPKSDTGPAQKMWGTARARISNLVTGVSDGFTKNLELVGVGYRAAVQGNNLQLQLGFSHDVAYPIPKGISMSCEKPTSISISGADKQKVGQVAAEIRAYRPPEPYKGKGVHYQGEQILRKEGKKK
ncbi:MAG: 50S ribosomal protein L6 [Rhodospirillales bacterium]|nr:50S ribosomal protein L6 [Rhodospirillales bacterium]MCW8951794.1 50S ribosomal protein L6 [Rhodospirillales bacterium]MCW8970006.1 50S ribosomal protein L6 [Rhodospirillales bacterium]MCW9002207.1 50S ribosomal protein L6 [Rhodospirillales bacterium]